MEQKKRVLLILPPNVTAINPFRSALKKPAPLLLGFPMGLGYISSYLLKEDKYDIKIIDANKDNLSLDEICKIIKDFDPQYIGMTIYTIISKVAVQLARKIKNEFNDKIIIAGGPHASTDYKNLLINYPFFDFIVIGEGEVTMLELLKVLDDGDFSKLNNIKGISYIDPRSHVLTFTGDRAIVRDINQFPEPARGLVDFKTYIKRDNLLPYAAEIMGSRGCTHRCVFCSFQKTWRARKSEEIAKEMKNLVIRYPIIKSFLFFDDNFSADKKRVIELCQVLIREGLNKYSWSCLCRTDQITEEMLLWMKRAGCSRILYGLETVDPEIMKNLNKKINPEQVEHIVALTTKIGIDAMTFFIIGSPGETFKTIEASYKFAKKLKCQSTTWSIMLVYPGTALAKIQPCKDFVDYLYEPEVDNPVEVISANVPVFENPGLDREILKFEHKKIFRRISIYKILSNPFFTIKKVLRAPLYYIFFLLRLFKHEKIINPSNKGINHKNWQQS